MQYGTQYEGIAVQQWEISTGKKADMCEMYFHPTGMLGATPNRLRGEKGVFEVKTLPKMTKKGITLEEYICDNEQLQDCPLYGKNGSYSLKNTHQIQGQMYLTGRKNMYNCLLNSRPYVIF